MLKLQIFLIFSFRLADRNKRDDSSSNFYITLFNGTNNANGIVTIKQRSDDRGGTICGAEWTHTDAIVVCRQMGFFSAYSFSSNAFFSSTIFPFTCVIQSISFMLSIALTATKAYISSYSFTTPDITT